ncbi:hypothetical protein, partial [Lonsdalea populi]|uniref:hypothetical protein n=1 Tax=Lonsdalea populi TaxID=1172565 RepID=UPI001C65AB18
SSQPNHARNDKKPLIPYRADRKNRLKQNGNGRGNTRTQAGQQLMVKLFYLKIVRADAQLNAITQPEKIGISTVRRRMRRVGLTCPIAAAASVTC